MQIIPWNELLTTNNKNFSLIQKSAITIGGFDGLHIGHTKLCKQVLAFATRNNIQAGVITFEHSPRLLKEQTNYTGDILSLRLKLKKFEKMGFDFIVVIDFSQEFSTMNGGIFLQILKDSLNVQFLTVGEGFRCGHKGKTDCAQISMFSNENSIDFLITPTISTPLQKISSSTIRELILSGNFEESKNLLGYNYELDVKNLPYTKIWQESELYIQFDHQKRQILPPTGKYCVDVFTQENKCFQSILLLDLNLRLKVPKEYENAQFDVIAFR